MARPKKIPFVIVYDFDGTLAPGNMQEYNFIPELDMDPEKFWDKAKALAKEQQADHILAYMQLMLSEANKSPNICVRKENFKDFGKNIKFFNGVNEWFNLINEYAKEKHVEVKHYIISSGLREMIEGTSIHEYFEKVYASGFMYDRYGIACWPALAVNYTTKTQYLFRINKGTLDEDDNSTINSYIPDEDRPVPFSHMVFIGDGETDVPCMRLVRSYGGHSIAVYKPSNAKAKKSAKQLVTDGRATFAAVADYSNGSDIHNAIKSMIDKVVAQSEIVRLAKKNQ